MSNRRLMGTLVLSSIVICLGTDRLIQGQNHRHHHNGRRTVFYPSNAIAGLTADQIQQFLAGEAAFNEFEGPEEGLGPIFNDVRCSACHPNGGGSPRISNIIGVGGALQIADGGPVIQLRALLGFVPEVVPTDVTVGRRRAMSTMGLGLVRGIADQDILEVQTQQAEQSPSMAGKANMVVDAVTGAKRVGRVGQKSQHPNATSFAAEAYLREIGITTPFFPNEEAPFNNPLLLVGNPFPGINNDGGDVIASGFFMDHLKPPTSPTASLTGSARSLAGAQLFTSMDCAVCHQPTWVTTTSSDASLNEITFSPYSDFLLHDMGENGDQIQQGTDSNGQAIGGSWMRTTPLWGVGGQRHLWHDASAGSITAAINKHAGQALASKAMFNALSPSQQQQLLAFLNSL